MTDNQPYQANPTARSGTSQPRLRTRPAELSEANAFVTDNHRHHKPVRGHRFSQAVEDETGTVRGVATIGRPVARKIDQRTILEVTRLATDGCPNACSALYGAACRIQRAHGYAKVITYILISEPGTSLRAAGWVPVAVSQGGEWDRPSRGRQLDLYPTEQKVRWECRCTDLPAIELPTQREAVA